jgi:hypothetical protein
MPVGVALSVDAPHDSHVSPSLKTFALRLLGAVGGVISPLDDSSSVIVLLSLPWKLPPSQATVADVALLALPVWNGPVDVATETTNVRDVPSHTGVNVPEPWAAPLWDTEIDDGVPDAPLGQATATAIVTPPSAPDSWPWSAMRAVTPGWRLIVRVLLTCASWPFRAIVTKARAVAGPRTHLLPLTTREEATCGAPVHVAVNVPEPPGVACRTVRPPRTHVHPTGQVTVTSTLLY